MTKILVRGNQKLVAILLRSLKQLAIVQLGPPSLEGRFDRVSGEMPTKGDGGALIEQNPHERTESANAFIS